MAWSSGSFTRVRGSASWTTDYNNNTGIEPGLHDTNDQDLAVGINNCIAKDGQNAATGNLDLGGNKLTNVGNATNAQDAVTLSQAQAGIDTQGTGLSINATRFSNDTNGPQISLRKSRGATVGTNTIVQSNDNLGFLVWSGANGTGYTSAASINAAVDGTPGASSDMPGRLSFSTTADGSGTLSERIRIDSSGRVGIGTGSPLTRTTVVGAGQDGAITDAGNKEAALRVSATSGNSGSGGQIEFGAGYGTFTQSYFAGIKGLLTDGTNNSAGNLAIYTRRSTTDTGLTEAMRIDSSGRVGIGATSLTHRLEIGDGSNPTQVVARLNAGTGTSSGAATYYSHGSTTSAAVGHWSAIVGGAQDNDLVLWSADDLRFVTAGGSNERMRITNGGEVYIAGTTDQGAYNLQVNGTGVWGAGAYQNGSDANIKEEVAPISSSLNIVKQLNPITFKYKEDWSKDRSTQTGFIAQELQDVLQNEVYLEGVVNDSGEYLSVAYQNIIPILTKAIQELSAKVEALEAQLAT